jgi:TfoX/Sxy family transcriptional regulator of competence genes
MASQKQTVDHLIDTLAPLPLTSRKMFGEYALYLDGVVVALVCDDMLWIKPTPGTAGALADCPPGEPFPGARNYVNADALLDDPDQAMAVLRVIARERPPPKPKKRKA